MDYLGSHPCSFWRRINSKVRIVSTGSVGTNGNSSQKVRIVVLGTGFAGSAFIDSFNRHIGRNGRKKVELTAIDRTNYLTFTPLLYEVATWQVYGNHISIPVWSRKKDDDYRFREDEVMEVIPERNEVVTRHGRINYDYLIMALGTENNDFGIKGVAENSIPLKTIKDAELIRKKILESFKASETKLSEELNYVVVGGGESGVELAASLKNYIEVLKRDYSSDSINAKVILIEAQDHIMKNSGSEFSTRLESYLRELGIELYLDAKVASVSREEVVLENGLVIKTRNVFWTAGVRSNPIASMLGGGLVQKKSGRIIVNGFLQIPSFENIYVIGDNALIGLSYGEKATPQTAAAAVQEGKYLGRRLASLINGRKYRSVFIYKDRGIMLTLGKFSGLCLFGNGLILSGFTAWLIWKLIHLLKITTFTNRAEVLSDWLMASLHSKDVTG